MSFISIRGVEHYYEWITADNSAGRSGKPVMVFLHGWAGSARYWKARHGLLLMILIVCFMI
jgi:pimeloyl-ACP methyl ester carboxylesterase